ncbi:MAG: hypothetical protein HGA45_20635 [Chloroflexales bacterium]|nr:hypothetical protein [Chloroflexales bacterium]
MASKRTRPAQPRTHAGRQAGEPGVEEFLGALGGPESMDEEIPAELLIDEVSGPHRHATFAITLYLNADNSVSRTRVSYTPPEDGDEKKPDRKPDQWQGWDAEKLLRLIVERGRLNISASEASVPVAKASAPGEVVSAAGLAAKAPFAAAAEPLPGPAPRLRHVALVGGPGNGPQRFVSCREVYRLQLDLDLAELFAAGERPQRFAVIVRAKHLGDGARLVVCEARGVIEGKADLSIGTYARTPPPGLYRLEADLELSTDAGSPPYHATTNLQGELVYVY